MSRISVLPIQKAVLESIEKGNSWTNICKRLGWMETNTKPESSRLQRSIGVRVNVSGRNSHPKVYSYMNKQIGDHTAIQIIEAIDLDPVDSGL